MVVGIWFGWFIMRWQILNSFISSIVAYIMLVALPKNIAHKAVFVWAIGYLSVSHIYRMMTDYMGWTMDFTGPQMLLTLKLTTFAFDYNDGFHKENPKLTNHQRHMMLEKLPTPLEFFAYVYFFGGFLAGPAFNMKEYLEFVDGSLFKDAPNGKMPSPYVPAFKKIIATLAVTIGVFLNMKYPLTYARTEEFFDHSFLYKILYMWMATSLCRFPYYFAWMLSEGSCILSGVGYSGTKDGVPQWERATNCGVINLETAQNFKAITECWNIRTDMWLKHYIYERVKVAPVAATFLMSAVWHGFYPGYYFSFMFASMVIQGARIIRRNIRPWFLKDDGISPAPNKIYYDIICVFGTSFTLNYLMAPFILLSFDASWKVWMSVNWIGHIICGIVFGLAFVIKPPRKQKAA